MRTFEDIVPPSRRAREAAPSETEAPGPLRIRPRQPRFPTFTVAVAVVVLALAVGALFYFSGAKVLITPTVVSAAVEGSWKATQGTGDLPFVLVSASKVATQNVAGSGTKNVSTFASGSVTVYNASGAAQRFIQNTRFQTTAGLVFRAHAAFSVPAGSSAKPGQATLTVYADRPGSEYNIAPSSFTLPGLAGGKLASAVYARSAQAFAGGASGTVPVIDSGTEAVAVSAMKAALAPELAAALSAQVPPGYVLLPGASETVFRELEPSASDTTGSALLKEEGTIRAVVFPNAALAKTFAASVSGLEYRGEPIALMNTDGLTLTKALALPDASSSDFSFSVSGTANLVYTVVPERIASAVAGKSRAEAQVALSSFPEVKEAVLILRPFWRTVFPQDPASIGVSVSAPAAP